MKPNAVAEIASLLVSRSALYSFSEIMIRNPTVNLKRPDSNPAIPTPVWDTVNRGKPTSDTLGGSAYSRSTNGLKDWSGEILGEYEISELIGVGGNGQVFKARHRCLDMIVALKILHGVEPCDEATVDRFRREAMASAKLIHPNLIRATDAGILDRHLFLVTDFVDGVDLNVLIQQQGPLSVANVCELGRAACEGLHFLALNDTVHRDIKPSNIMVDKAGQVRVLDLGLARSNDLNQSLTVEGQIMGTLDYMSPEQALNPRNVSFHADMYSMGCTLYFLLAGKAPFQEEAYETIAAKLLAHVETPPVPINAIRPDVPDALGRIVMAMLEKHPEDRPTSFEDVINVLSRHAKGSNLREVVGGDAQKANVRMLEPPPSTLTRRRSQSTSTKPSSDGNSLLRALIAFSIVLGVGWWALGNWNQSPQLSNDEIMSLFGSQRALTHQWHQTNALKVVEESEQTQLPSADDFIPPKGIAKKALKDWHDYLESCNHKAWVYDSATGNWGYATRAESPEAAILEARKYGGMHCKPFSVDGITVKPSPLHKQPVETKTLINPFVVPSSENVAN